MSLAARRHLSPLAPLQAGISFPQTAFLRVLPAVLAGLLFLLLSRPSSGAVPAQAPTPTTQPQPTAQVVSLLLDGYAALDQGDFPGALARFNQALTIARQLADHAAEVESLNALGALYREQGLDLLEKNNLQGALEQNNQAVAVFHQAGSRQDEGRALQAVGTVYEYRYDYSKATDFYQQALVIAREIGDRTGETAAIDSLGDVARGQGQSGRALDLYQRALTIARERAAAAPNSSQEYAARVDESGILASIAGVYESQSRYPEALALLQQQLETARNRIGRASDPGDSLRAQFYAVQEVRVVNSLGLVYSDLGQHAKALELHQHAFDLAQHLDDKDLGVNLQATLLSNIATDYENLEQPEQAIAYYRQALEQVRASHDRLREQVLLNNLGVAYADLKQFDQALAYGQQALPIAREVGDRAGEATDLSLIGSSYIGLTQYDRAIEAYQQAVEIAREIGDRRREGIILRRTGEAYEKLGDLQQALEFDRQGLTTEEDILASARLEELKASLATQSAKLYSQTALVLLRLGRPEEAFDMTERARARSFLDQLGNTPLDLAQRANPQLLQQEQNLAAEISALDSALRRELAKPAAQQGADGIRSLSAQLTAKQQEYTDLLTQLRLSDPESASLVSIAPLRLTDVQGLLDPNTTLVSFFVTQDQTLAFVVTQAGFREIDLPVSVDDLRAAVVEFRRFTNPTDATPARSLQQLYDWLVAPISDQLTTRLVGIIPNGVLNYLPFAALWDGQQYLGDRYTLFELPSASALPFIQAKRKDDDATALVMARAEVEGFPLLQYADQEARSIAELFGTQPLLGADATEAALKTQAGRANVLHVAGHGELNSASPLFSRILLGPDGGDDGSLEVREVYGLRLTDTDLVVLSACQTQLGVGPQPGNGGASNGDEFVGLNRAFIYAGSPTVIASLWEVNDHATAILMAAFYGHLQRGLSKAQALQAAQADTRQQFPNPYYWAPFVLTGEPGKSTKTPSDRSQAGT